MHIKSILVAAGFLAVATLAMAAEEKVNLCKDAVSTPDMIACADEEYQLADKALNVQWAKSKAAIEGWDKDRGEGDHLAVEALTKAQRAWIQYRDAHCDVDGYSAYGGTLMPAVISQCLADLTSKRTAELEDLINGL